MGIIGYNNWDYVIIGYNLTIKNGLYNSWDLMGLQLPQSLMVSSSENGGSPARCLVFLRENHRKSQSKMDDDWYPHDQLEIPK